MYRVLHRTLALLGLLALLAAASGCVGFYTLSEAADPPPPGSNSSAGLPLFPASSPAPGEPSVSGGPTPTPSASPPF
jgi:hypothetical protein